METFVSQFSPTNIATLAQMQLMFWASFFLTFCQKMAGYFVKWKVGVAYKGHVISGGEDKEEKRIRYPGKR